MMGVCILLNQFDLIFVVKRDPKVEEKDCCSVQSPFPKLKTSIILSMLNDADCAY